MGDRRDGRRMPYAAKLALRIVLALVAAVAVFYLVMLVTAWV